MKIVCDACGTKYSISDDKVTGRAFKIRCKRCSNVITLRGAVAVFAGSEAVSGQMSAGPARPDPASDAIWHAVIDQQQVGPLTIEAIADHAAGGRVTGDSYVWCEGQDDWQPAVEIAELAAALGLVRAPAVVEPASVADVDEPAPAHGRLHGERNESSVLFTLGSLARMANPPPRDPVASPTEEMVEGSGLIDIRSMASAYLGGTAPRPTTTVGIGSIDDLPAFAATAFVEPPVLIPQTASRTPRSPLVPVLIALVAALAVVAVVLVVMLARRDDAPVAGPTARASLPGDPAGPRTDGTGPAPATPTPPLPVSPPTAVVPPLDPAVTPPLDSAATPPHDPAPLSGTRPRSSTQTPARAVPARPAKERDDSPKDPTQPSCDHVTCMMSDYRGDCCAQFRPAPDDQRRPRDPAPSRTGLPEILELGAVRAGMASVKAKVVACGGRSSARGEVKVGVKVSADGAVTSATVKITPDRALGDCVASAIKKATFAKTRNGGAFTYPQRF